MNNELVFGQILHLLLIDRDIHNLSTLKCPYTLDKYLPIAMDIYITILIWLLVFSPLSERQIQANYSGHSFVNPAIQQATNLVDSAINQTIKNLFNKNRTHSVQDLITIFRYPSADALQLARAEEIFEQTLEIIQRHVVDGHKYNLSNKGKYFIRRTSSVRLLKHFKLNFYLCLPGMYEFIS